MSDIKQALTILSDEVWQRLRARLDGLTDAEYLWEPAPGCWTIREGRDGRWRHDWARPGPDPEPFTTIAWRLWHVIDLYGEDRAPRWLDIPPQGDAIGLDDPNGAPPATALEALELLDRAHDLWDAHLGLVSEDSLGEKIGPVGGVYAERTRASYVLHMIDEFIHHSAEISLLRDLWRWQHPLGGDELTERAMRGDVSLIDEVPDLDPEAATDLVRTAAAYARWDLVRGLVEAGAAVPATGTTPLHVAAGAGVLDTVEFLVEHGSDATARDPEFNATPLDWARFLRQPAVAAWLETRPERGS